jgi:hypothetical protein
MPAPIPIPSTSTQLVQAIPSSSFSPIPNPPSSAPTPTPASMPPPIPIPATSTQLAQAIPPSSFSPIPNPPSSAPAPTPASMPPPIATSTQLAQAIPPSPFSPIPNPSSASASTSTAPAPAPAPTAIKKKKIAISEDLALADLEWFKAKQQKKLSEGASKTSKASTVTPAPATSTAGKEVKVTSVPEGRTISDSLWLEMKRKKGPGAAHKVTAGESEEGKVASSFVTVEPQQVVYHPDSAGTGSTPEFDPKSAVNDSKHMPVGQTMNTVSSSGSTANVSSSALMSDDTPCEVAPSAHNQTSSRPPDPVAPMDVDQPQSEPGAEVSASATVEQLSGDVSSTVPAPSTSADSRIIRDVEMLPLDPTSTTSERATRDSAVAEPSITTSIILDSASVTHPADENAVIAENRTKDEALANQEPLIYPLPVSGSHFSGFFQPELISFLWRLAMYLVNTLSLMTRFGVSLCSTS